MTELEFNLKNAKSIDEINKIKSLANNPNTEWVVTGKNWENMTTIW